MLRHHMMDLSAVVKSTATVMPASPPDTVIMYGAMHSAKETCANAITAIRQYPYPTLKRLIPTQTKKTMQSLTDAKER